MSDDNSVKYVAQTSYAFVKTKNLNEVFGGTFANVDKKFKADKTKYKSYDSFEEVILSSKTLELTEILVKEQQPDIKSMLFLLADGEEKILCDVSYYSRSGTFVFYIYSKNLELARQYIKEVCANIEPPPKEKDSSIGIKFWNYDSSSGTGSYTKRDIDSNKWEEIKGNYSKDTAEELDNFIDKFKSKTSKLAIFVGPPGTGKTTVIRSLFNEWKSDSEGNYILDPPEFFNGTPRYMMDLIVGRDISNFIDPFEESFMSDEELKSKKMILIFEDCGELIGKNAKANVGAGLSKFLNMIDGMIGHGLNIGVILTANEDITEFHDAVVRPGRVSALIKFDRFSVEETEEWFKENGVEITEELSAEIKKENGLSLAECFDKLKTHGSQLKKPKSKAKKIGFGA